MVFTEGSVFSIWLILNAFSNLFLQFLCIGICLLLLLCIDFSEDLVGKDSLSCITIQATAAGTTDETREEPSDFLDYEQHQEDTRSDGVKDDVGLLEPLRLNTRQKADADCNELRDGLEETRGLIILTLTNEDVWIREHVHADKEVKQQRVLNDVASTVSEVGAVPMRHLVELEQHVLVSPVGD